MKIISVTAARPNFIKLAPLHRAFQKYNDEHPGKQVQHLVCHTGQHYDDNMSRVFFEELQLPQPDFNLGIGSGSHAVQTGGVLVAFEKVLLKEKPALVITAGDVNSTLAAALASVKLGIKTAHIEAGLRSYDMSMPEEINRVAADCISNYLFVPSEAAAENLRKEGLTKNVYNTGDIMYDTVLQNLPLAEKRSRIMEKLNLKPRGYYLVTLHRPFNVDNPAALQNILNILGRSGHRFIFPVHPRTRKSLEGLPVSPNIALAEPAGYLDSLILQKNAVKVITDSGGMQKEAFFLETPCITLRPSTEWTETVDAGANILVKNVNETELTRALNKEQKWTDTSPYGKGDAAERIVEIVMNGVKKQ